MRDVILEARGLTKRFRSREEGKRSFTAVDNASLSLCAGETLGLLGESGSGKSTLGQMLVGLIRPDEGTILYRGQPLPFPFKGVPRQKIQILFQHPEVSFNPQLTLRQSLSEPFRLRGKPVTDEALAECISRFGLYPEHLERRPGALSGGELQRAALARILVMEPEFILLDEPTSMLDVITQAQIVDFLRRYREEHGTSYLFITHSTSLAEQVCHRIIHIRAGVLAEEEVPERKGGEANEKDRHPVLSEFQ